MRAAEPGTGLTTSDIGAIFNNEDDVTERWRASVDELLVSGYLEWVYVPKPCLQLTAAGRAQVAVHKAEPSQLPPMTQERSSVLDRSYSEPRSDNAEPRSDDVEIVAEPEPQANHSELPIDPAQPFDSEQLAGKEKVDADSTEERAELGAKLGDTIHSEDVDETVIDLDAQSEEFDALLEHPNKQDGYESKPTDAEPEVEPLNDGRRASDDEEASQLSSELQDATPVELPSRSANLEGDLGSTKRYYVPSKGYEAPTKNIPLQEEDGISPIVDFWQRHRRRMVFVAALALTMTLAILWWTRTTFVVPDNMVVAGDQLRLNGFGAKLDKGILRDYEVALYLPRRTTSGATIRDMSGAKRVMLRFSRNIDPDDMLERLLEAVRPNLTPSQLTTLQKEFDLLREIFATMSDGVPLYIDYVPDQGTLFSKNKEVLLRMPSEDFFYALADIWIGEEPISYPLKRRLLGLPDK